MAEFEIDMPPTKEAFMALLLSRYEEAAHAGVMPPDTMFVKLHSARFERIQLIGFRETLEHWARRQRMRIEWKVTDKNTHPSRLFKIAFERRGVAQQQKMEGGTRG